MSWYDNPIANMYGPDFLVFYAIVIVGAFILWRLFSASAKRAGDSPIPLLSSRPDPYEIAYLRNGRNGVLELILMSLFERSFLVSKDRRKIEKNLGHPDPGLLNEIERKVFLEIGFSVLKKDVYRKVRDPIRDFCDAIDLRLKSANLLVSREAVSKLRTVKWVLAIGCFSLGAYKLQIALSRGHTNVIFLLAMMIIAPILIALLCKIPRLNNKGKEYLDRLQSSLASLRDRMQRPVDSGDSVFADALILAAVFGGGVLVGTAFGDIADAAAMPVVQPSSGGCGGGGCGGGSDGSSSGCSGGGGGGGCGGGGCGGCGGGD